MYMYCLSCCRLAQAPLFPVPTSPTPERSLASPWAAHLVLGGMNRMPMELLVWGISATPTFWQHGASVVYHGGHCPVTMVTLVARIADTLGAACSESPRCGALTQCGGTGYPGGAWPRCTRERDGRFPFVALRLPEVG